MTMIASQVFDPGMQLSDFDLSFCPVLPAFLFTGKGPLGSVELRKRGFEVSRVRDMLTVARGQEVLDANIEADGREGIRGRFQVGDFEADLEIPLISFTGGGQGPDLGIVGQRPMKADFYDSGMLYPKPVTGQSYAVAVRRELDAGKAVGWLESRIARLCSGFESAEEGLKCFV